MGKSKDLATLTDDSVTFNAGGTFTAIKAASTQYTDFELLDTTNNYAWIMSNRGTSPASFEILTRDASNTYTQPLKIDASGRVTMPYQPAFSAYPSTTYTIGGTGFYDIVQADSVKSNVGSCYNTSTYLFTAPVAGSYAFFGILRFNSHSGSYLRAAFAINGTNDLTYGADINQDTGNYTTCSIASVIQLSANDTVSLVGRSQSDASVDISNAGTTFSGHLIG